ncbi:MAG: TIGR03643 family protein [Oligoflexales bacterium]|nr:TIGR03643 family protein [Oligoflexales bacterium]
MICAENNEEQYPLDRIIEMAWEDRTPFEAISFQTGLNESEVIKIVRNHLKPSSFKLWRKRVSGRSTKHRCKFGRTLTKHRCPSQGKRK